MQYLACPAHITYVHNSNDDLHAQSYYYIECVSSLFRFQQVVTYMLSFGISHRASRAEIGVGRLLYTCVAVNANNRKYAEL